MVASSCLASRYGGSNYMGIVDGSRAGKSPNVPLVHATNAAFFSMFCPASSWIHGVAPHHHRRIKDISGAYAKKTPGKTIDTISPHWRAMPAASLVQCTTPAPTLPLTPGPLQTPAPTLATPAPSSTLGPTPFPSASGDPTTIPTPAPTALSTMPEIVEARMAAAVAGVDLVFETGRGGSGSCCVRVGAYCFVCKGSGTELSSSLIKQCDSCSTSGL